VTLCVTVSETKRKGEEKRSHTHLKGTNKTTPRVAATFLTLNRK